MPEAMVLVVAAPERLDPSTIAGSEPAHLAPVGQTWCMASYDDGPVSIHYDVEGSGFPVLLI
ncbi:MAG TPA: hypothetical protein VLA10_00570, partial [Ilumatobacter sp.]|nr:hypothetical protein [Ilumatobacter sp.]